MKNLFKLISICTLVMTMLMGCEDAGILNPQKSLYPDVSDCKWPDYLDSFTLNRNLYYSSVIASNQGTYLLYNFDNQYRHSIINLNTGEYNLITFKSMLPKQLEFESLISAAFCPYDENKILLLLLLSTDSLGNGRGFVEGKYLYLFDHRKNELTDVTPKFFGEFGKEAIGNPHVVRWLNSSSPGNDNIFLRNYGEYNLQSQTVKTPLYNKSLYLAMSPDGKNYLRGEHGEFISINPTDPFSDGYKQSFCYLNNVLLQFDSLFITTIGIEDFQFTSDGKYLVGAISRGQFIPNPLDIHGNIDTTKIIPKEKLNTKELFVIDVEKTLNSGKLVLAYNFSFVKKYCLFRVNSVIPLTNNSVTISMSYDRSDIAEIYEMSFDGRILRKLRK